MKYFKGKWTLILSWLYGRNVHKICCVLLVIVFVQFYQGKHLTEKKKQVSGTLMIYKQMHNYSQNVCMVQPTPVAKKESFAPRDRVEGNTTLMENKVTFILICQPNLVCANSRLKELREMYPYVKVILVFHGEKIIPTNHDLTSFPFLKEVVNLGGFKNSPEALRNAILVVKTEYFMLFDSQLAVDKLQANFVEKLMANFHGFNVLGGSLINGENEFSIPCMSFKLRNWTYFEMFEYHAKGNVLQCDSTSPHFFADTESFKKLVMNHIDVNISVMWREDFFLTVRGLLTVGTLPEVILRNSGTKHCPLVKSSKTEEKRIDSLLPFVNKHQVLNFIDQDGNKISICDGTKTKICSLKYVLSKWQLHHMAYSGLTGFPFFVERLVNALHFGTTLLEKAGIKYVLEGGTLLGFIKIRAILPWDYLDVDTFVFSNRRPIIDLIKNVKRKRGYGIHIGGRAFHVYVTPYYPARDGQIVFMQNRNEPQELIKVRLDGKLFPVPTTMFRFIREFYGSSYLETRGRLENERLSCEYKGHQACLPDCRWDGCGSGRHQFPGILS